MYKVAYLGPVVGRYTWLANEVLKSILYRYKNTGLLGHLFQDPINYQPMCDTWLEIAIAYRRYLFFIPKLAWLIGW